MGRPSRWLNWRPAPACEFENGAPPKKPSKPTKPTPQHGSVGFVGSDFAADPSSEPHRGLGLVVGRRPELTAIRTVQWRLVGGPPLTIVRHKCDGENRFGQNAREYPYCVIDLAAWRERPFDLRAARWFRSCEDVLAQAAGRGVAPADDAAAEVELAEARIYRAGFAGGVTVELRVQGSGRWLMWVSSGGRFIRRKDFASPALDHAKATAEHWYGPPLHGWQVPGEDPK